MHTKYGVIQTYDDKVMLRTRNALKNQSKGNNSKTEQERVTVFVHYTSLPETWWQSYALDKKYKSAHFESLPEACIPSLESFGLIMTKVHSRQGMRDDADDADN